MGNGLKPKTANSEGMCQHKHHGAVSGIGYDSACLLSASQLWSIRPTVQECFLKCLETLLAHYGIMDAMYTQEHWVTCPVMMHGGRILGQGF